MLGPDDAQLDSYFVKYADMGFIGSLRIDTRQAILQQVHSNRQSTHEALAIRLVRNSHTKPPRRVVQRGRRACTSAAAAAVSGPGSSRRPSDDGSQGDSSLRTARTVMGSDDARSPVRSL